MKHHTDERNDINNMLFNLDYIIYYTVRYHKKNKKQREIIIMSNLTQLVVMKLYSSLMDKTTNRILE